jgi:hypothetical protein
MSDRFKVKYCRALAMLRYQLMSRIGCPSEAEALGLVSEGVFTGLQLLMPARSRTSSV